MLAMSEVELGGYLLPPGEHPRFDRGDFTLIPNPRRLFGQVLPYFYYYFEVYPPESATGAADYEIRRYLVSGSGDTAKVLKPIAMTGGPGFFADIDSVGLGGVPSGTYNFTVEVIDAGGARAMQSAKMFVFAPEVPAGEALTTGGAGEYDSAAVERELQEIQFLLSKNETLVATKLSPAEKGRFLENFWRRYDDDPTTPEVPLRQLFRVRVDEADARWGNSRTAGHKSDRGRVYVLYGEPDERETHPLDIHAKPYEIWNYNNLEGGVTFVFVDRSGLGDFMLVHSTLRGEVVNTDWYREFVQRSGMDSRR